MAQEEAIKLFEGLKIRIVWDDEKEKYYFSVVDIIQVLTESAEYQTARKYWKVLKGRLAQEGNETVTNCYQLKMTAADGKQRLTDVADTEQVLRLIQSVPSKKAEPFKQWLAQVGAERIRQMQDPERSIEQAVQDYRRLGYSENWINQRIKTIEIRKALTDSVDPADYFKKMRRRDAELNDFVTGTNCPPHQFASTDGKILENENRPQVVDDSIEAIRPQIVDRLLNDLFSVPWGHHKYMANDTTVE